MRALLDINFVIALLDAGHVFHQRAHTWWAVNMRDGWATCPIVENGVVRIMTTPAYSASRRFTVDEIVLALSQFANASDHEFWPDSLSIRDGRVFAMDIVQSGKVLTDLYLLALAVENAGRLVTFDQGVSIAAIKNADARNLVVL